MIKKCGIIYFDIHDKKYLLVFGKKSSKWGFPKGHQELGETEEDTAIREFYEETGIKITHHDLLEKIRFKNNIYFNVVCKTRPNFNIQDTREILKASWFSIHEMIALSKDTVNYGLKSWMNSVIDVNTEFRLPKFVNNHENFNSKSIVKYC
jgi:8-oxo-dGTP pyrophosphatase MutT (NUDIX family)